MSALGRGAIRLTQQAATADVVTLGARVTFGDRPLRLRYRTRTGALLRIDGVVAGAFDGKHASCDLAALPGEHDLTLEVERRALPVAGLPPGDGVRWRWMLARSEQSPQRTLEIDVRHAGRARNRRCCGGLRARASRHRLAVDACRYQAQSAAHVRDRTARESKPGPYVFAQSQPQLYAWVEAADPELFARVRARVGRGWDAERRDDVGRAGFARAQRRIGPAPVRVRHALRA